MEHPITPPPKLVMQWLTEVADLKLLTPTSLDYLATQAARWGADQELEACIDVILSYPGFESPELFVEVLRAARRPKPPSLKEQALAALAEADGADYPVICTTLTADQHALIRRALEQLDD